MLLSVFSSRKTNQNSASTICGCKKKYQFVSKYEKGMIFIIQKKKAQVYILKGTIIKKARVNYENRAGTKSGISPFHDRSSRAFTVETFRGVSWWTPAPSSSRSPVPRPSCSSGHVTCRWWKARSRSSICRSV